MRKLEEQARENGEKDFPRSWTGRINAIAIFILSKAIYRFITISIKILKTCFRELGKNAKTHMKTQKTLNGQSNLEQKNKPENIHISRFQVIP